MKFLSELSNATVLKAFTMFSIFMLVFVWYLVEFISKEVKNSKLHPRSISEDILPENNHFASRARSQEETETDSLVFDFKKFVLDETSKANDISYDRYLVASPVVNRLSLPGTFCTSEPWVAMCGVGLAAYLLVTLDHLGICYLLGATPTVSWRNCTAVCSKSQNINSWNWYFEPLNPGIENKTGRGFCLGDSFGLDHLNSPLTDDSPKTMNINSTYLEPRTLLNLSFQPRQSPGFEGYSNLITRGIRQWAHFLITKYIRINKEIQDSVDTFYKKYMMEHTLLAVHIRGTDHADETDSPTLPPLSAWIQTAGQIFSSLPTPKKIFVAGDNTEAIKEFVAHFGSKNVVFTKALRAKRYVGEPVHDSGYDPYKLGSQVLTDILLMSKCDHFLHAESSVAALVAYFNPALYTHFFGFRKQVQETNEQAQAKDYKKKNLQASKSDDHDMDTYIECFRKNSPYSTCHDMNKGSFLRVSELKHFTGHKS